MRILIYITIFHAILCFCLFAEETEEEKGDIESKVQPPRVSLQQANWTVEMYTTIFKESFYNKVEKYAYIEGMNFDYAKHNNMECLVSDLFDTLRIVSFEDDANRKPSKEIEFEANLQRSFMEKSDKDVVKEYDENAGILRAATPLKASSKCQTCHPPYNKDNTIGAMIFTIPVTVPTE